MGNRLTVSATSEVWRRRVTRTVAEEPGLLRVIGAGGAGADGVVPGLADGDLLRLYRDLVLLRVYDERSVAFHRQGRIGTYAVFYGHEAIQVGAAAALRREDWIFPTYRESAIG